MRVPRKIYICGETWTVQYCKQRPDWARRGMSAKDYGRADLVERRIYIRNTGHTELDAQTFAHEVAHALLSYAYRTSTTVEIAIGRNSVLDELLTCGLERALWSLLRDNDLTFIAEASCES